MLANWHPETPFKKRAELILQKTRELGDVDVPNPNTSFHQTFLDRQADTGLVGWFEFSWSVVNTVIVWCKVTVSQMDSLRPELRIDARFHAQTYTAFCEATPTRILLAWWLFIANPFEAFTENHSRTAGRNLNNHLAQRFDLVRRYGLEVDVLRERIIAAVHDRNKDSKMPTAWVEPVVCLQKYNYCQTLILEWRLPSQREESHAPDVDRLRAWPVATLAIGTEGTRFQAWHCNQSESTMPESAVGVVDQYLQWEAKYTNRIHAGF